MFEFGIIISASFVPLHQISLFFPPLPSWLIPSRIRRHFWVSFFCFELQSSQLDCWLIDHAGVPTLMKLSARLLFCRNFEVQTGNEPPEQKWLQQILRNADATRNFDAWFYDAGLKWYESLALFVEQTRFLWYLGIFRWGTNNAEKV